MGLGAKVSSQHTLLWLSCFASALVLVNAKLIGPTRFDYYALVLSWPGGHCLHNDCHNSFATEVNDFHISGFWAMDKDNKVRTYCNTSAEFDPNKLGPLRPALDEAWPDSKRGDLIDFWRAQWHKYGNCDPQSIPDEYTYFTKALEFFELVNPLDALAKKGLLPSSWDVHDTHSIYSTFIRAYGVRPQMYCKEEGQGHVADHHLIQVRFCISSDGEYLHDCPQGGNCKGELFIPEIEYSRASYDDL
mmetsp:Transcript_18745/g.22443  ORF Transcript_18745/g.22443 Transcript_18745/m.22443 type:complete len:246 (+) Transcript_18745:107-844(+)|eukprot:CAMPEP_0197860852 /NCGR_PEP_ID=MMETSP1438-20131217/36506_1 /TAXON_ID=1461541 /ORGANISM="Pterosperma sp., Strain CCMP1384" /LENGTH=245 /DNA_ID=CAMNT_0043477851 /DNA_START=88 /DNA_END=825 /DNA_ORIENTATION=+